MRFAQAIAQLRPFLCEFDASGCAFKEFHLQLFLELPDLDAHRRMGAVQLLASKSKTSFVCDSEEGLKQTQVDVVYQFHGSLIGRLNRPIGIIIILASPSLASHSYPVAIVKQLWTSKGGLIENTMRERHH